MNTHIGDKIFQDTSRRVAKFRENRPRDVEKSVVGKRYSGKFAYRYSDTRATAIKHVYMGRESLSYGNTR